MAEKQEFKAVFGNSEIFFVSHVFDSAVDKVHRFVERNKGKFDCAIYRANNGVIGERWIFVEEYKCHKKVLDKYSNIV